MTDYKAIRDANQAEYGKAGEILLNNDFDLATCHREDVDNLVCIATKAIQLLDKQHQLGMSGANVLHSNIKLTAERLHKVFDRLKRFGA